MDSHTTRKNLININRIQIYNYDYIPDFDFFIVFACPATGEVNLLDGLESRRILFGRFKK